MTGKVHALVAPVQAPPQAVPKPAQEVRVPRGWPEGTLAQVPRLPATSQASQAPVQAALQQKPSTHFALVHWAAAVQVPPRGLSPQLPEVQTLVPEHSAFEAQVVRQVSPAASQTNAPHDWETRGGH